MFANFFFPSFAGQDPPNFLIASDFTKHVKPAAVVKEEETEPEPEVEESVDNLIDMSMPEVGTGFIA